VSHHHHCEQLEYAVEADDVPLSYVPEYREWGIDYTDGGTSFLLIQFCPWDGTRLPESLRIEWFRRMRDEFGLDPGGDPDLEYPEEMRSDRWWKEAGL
jgi:hypothetical protein